jgi:glycosyltransferase involved in cell wall biosynthesis
VKYKTYYPPKKLPNEKIRIIFYHISGLHYAGTEKFIQILAKHLNKEKFEVTFVYSAKSRTEDGFPSDTRKSYLENTGVKLVPFSYSKLEGKYPHFVVDMEPSLNSLLHDFKPHIAVTTGTGYSEFPFNIERQIPIININNFGSPNNQKNVEMNICVSNLVSELALRATPREKLMTMYVQSERPLSCEEEALEIRRRFGIKDTDTVFGRIGRADNVIFDSIGIEAFKQVQKMTTGVHYIVMSPPPVLEEMVINQNIKNVHFLPRSGSEKDIWAFHRAIDVLGHFRKDGESFGLNIAESMLVGNPILTHKSRIWNAHLEYLDESFARVADIDNVEQYASNMLEMINLKNNGKISGLRRASLNKGQSLFLIESNIRIFEKLAEKIVSDLSRI